MNHQGTKTPRRVESGPVLWQVRCACVGPFHSESATGRNEAGIASLSSWWPWCLGGELPSWEGIMSNDCIRTLRDGDLATIISIWNRALVRNPISAGRFVSMVFADPDYWPGEDSGFLVATRGDAVVGFLRAIIRRVPNDRLGMEPEDGFIPYLAVDPAHQRSGIGTSLLNAALDYLTRHGRKRVWVCGTTTSAPGSISPGVDVDAYAPALALFEKHGFTVNQHGYSMSREVVDFEVAAFETLGVGDRPRHQGRIADSGARAGFARIHGRFAARLPGTSPARGKTQSGGLGEMLIALSGDKNRRLLPMVRRALRPVRRRTQPPRPAHRGQALHRVGSPHPRRRWPDGLVQLGG